MTMPFYASAEQIMRDRAEYARKNIARGRAVVVLNYAEGVLFVAENPQQHAAQGRRDLRPDRVRRGRPVQRVREPAGGRRSGWPTSRGYSYDRRDVTGRALANAYAQTLGAIFTEQQKPYEVELCVAEVGETPAEDQLYRLLFDGSIVDEPEYVVLGGQGEPIVAALKDGYRADLPLAEALALADPRARHGRRRQRQAARAGRATSSRSRCSTAAGPTASSAGCRARR